MTNIAISCENLGKRYRIGQRESYKALRDTITDAARAPFRRLRSSFGNHSTPRESIDETFWALRDVSFEVKHGEVVGIIGRNGAGKSTLLKILSRITKPTTGTVEIHGRVGSLLEVGTGFHPELTGRENIYLNGTILGMKKREIERKFDEIVAFAEIEKFLDTPVKRYSSGMYVRLAFAVAAHLEPEILIVDEVLAVGDVAFQKKCLGKMSDVAQKGRTIIFVSHNMGAVSNLCSHGIVLTSGEIDFDGSVHSAVDFYNEKFSKERHLNNEQPAHILYDSLFQNSDTDFIITKIEAFELDGSPKPIIKTWDNVVFRFWYKCRKFVERGAINFEVSVMGGSRLLTLSTQPDSILPLTFEVGEHCVECVIEQIPLASGTYIIGMGLTVPNVQWLWHEIELCDLIIASRDVYQSGLAPSSPRSPLAIPHYWRKVA